VLSVDYAIKEEFKAEIMQRREKEREEREKQKLELELKSQQTTETESNTTENVIATAETTSNTI
jgi:hypothetical protein